MSFYQAENDSESALTIWYGHVVPVESHFHRNIELIYLMKGKVTASYYDKPFTLNQNEIFFVESFAPHQLELQGEAFAIVVIVPNLLSVDFSNVLQSHTFNYHLKDTVYNEENILPFLKQFALNRNFDNLDLVTNPIKNSFLEKGCVNIILGQLIANYPLIKRKPHKNTDILIQVLQYIADNFQKNITLDDIANHFGYNKYYISKLFNKQIGQNLRSYINNLRLQKYECDTKSGINDKDTYSVMKDCGFENTSTFYRSAKKYKSKH